MFQQQIPCPVCSTKIPFDTMQLIAGVQFVCPNCQVLVGLSNESKPVVQEAIKKFNELKKNTSEHV